MCMHVYSVSPRIEDRVEMFGVFDKIVHVIMCACVHVNVFIHLHAIRRITCTHIHTHTHTHTHTHAHTHTHTHTHTLTHTHTHSHTHSHTPGLFPPSQILIAMPLKGCGKSYALTLPLFFAGTLANAA